MERSTAVRVVLPRPFSAQMTVSRENAIVAPAVAESNVPTFLSRRIRTINPKLAKLPHSGLTTPPARLIHILLKKPGSHLDF
jgi:hypothetical protein